MFEGTKGPWFVELDTDTIRYGEQTADGLNPNSFEVEQFGGQEGLANAKLIATAPELFEFVQMVLREQQELSNGDAIYISKALSLISKIEG